MQLIFEMTHSPPDLAHTMVKSAFVVMLHLQDPSLNALRWIIIGLHL